MKEDIISEASIKQLVDDFYQKVRRHSQLGPVFDAAIGTSDAEWRPHLEKMYAFWSSIMLTSGRYHGNPLQKHKDLPAFDSRLFDLWLELFGQTVQALHTPEIAALYVAKSQRIAEHLKFALHQPQSDFPIIAGGTS